MKVRTAIARLALIAWVAHACPAQAACMDPETLVSGYKAPLDLEVREAEAIVVGRVLSKQALQEDPGDPDGITAYRLRIRVLSTLKGHLPRVFAVRDENTSARYRALAGERHLLFVSRADGAYWIDSCGNSAPLPGARRLAARVRTALHDKANH